MDKDLIVKRFDPETGQIDKQLLASYEDAEVHRIVDEGLKVKQMAETPGWKIIEDLLLDIIEKNKERLIDLNDFEEIKRSQATLRAFSNVLGLVASTIAQGEHLSQYQRGPSEG